MSLKQGGSVTEYRDAFETLAVALRGVPEPIFRGVFLNGLREDIRAEVKLHRPINLQEAMDLAQQVEDRNEAQDNFRRLCMGRMWRLDGPAQGASKGVQPRGNYPFTQSFFQSSGSKEFGTFPRVFG